METELSRLIDALPGLVWTATPDGRADYINLQWSVYTGMSLQDAAGFGWQSAVHSDDLTPLFNQWGALTKLGKAGQAEGRLRRTDGAYRWFKFNLAPLPEASGQVLKWGAMITDIDSQKETEALAFKDAMLDSERYARWFLNSIPGMTALMKPDGQIEAVNHKIVEYFGKTQEELEKWGTSDAVHPDDLPAVYKSAAAAYASGQPYTVEHRIRGVDGIYRWHESTGLPLRDGQGRVVRYCCLMTNIDDRKRAEAALQESERNLKTIINTLPTTAWSTRPDGYCDFLSDRWLSYAGFSASDAIGWNWGSVIHPDDREGLFSYWKGCLEAGTAVDTEARMRRFDGEYRWFLFRANPFRDEHGTIVKWYGTNIDIEDRKRADEELRQTNRYLQEAQRLSLTGSFTYDINEVAGYWSEELFRIFGFEPTAKIFPEKFMPRFHPDDRALAERTMNLTPGGSYELELRLLMPDGAIKHLQAAAQRVDDQPERPVVIGCARDITERKLAEEKLRRAHSYLEEGQRLSRTGTVIADLIADEHDWSEEAYSIFEFDLSEKLIFARIRERLHPSDVAAVEAVMRDTAPGGNFDFECRLKMPTGSVKYIHVVGRRIDEQPNQRVLLACMQDITARHLVDQQLRRINGYLEEAQRLSLTGSFTWDVQADEHFWSNETFRIFDLEPVEKVGIAMILSRLHPNDTGLAERVIGGAVDGKDFETGLRLLMPNGSIKHIDVVGHRIGEIVDRPVFLGCIRDVTASKKAEEVIRRNTEYLTAAEALSKTGSTTLDWSKDEHHWSDELYRIWEYPMGSNVTPHIVSERIHPEDMQIFREFTANAVGKRNFEFRLQMPDGRIKYLRAVAHAFRVRPGAPQEGVAAIQDVTEQRRSEQTLAKVRSELAHVARVAALGTLTASIAHEVNQPLSGIITNASTCLRMLAADPPNIDGARETARRAIRDGNRAAEVITRLRALFARKTTATDAIDLSEAIREVIALSANELQRGEIILGAELADGLPRVTGDRVQLQQVVLNLLLNAIEAMNGVEGRSRQLTIRTEADLEGGVRVAVQDTGVGIEAQEAERLFEAFHTTKPNGMGIGLSVSRSIVESHGGRLWANRNDGPGATFAFVIPAGSNRSTEIDV